MSDHTTLECPNCHTYGEAERDECGVSLQTTTCAEHECDVELCDNCEQYVCPECKRVWCEKHYIILADGSECPACLGGSR